jgi:hypothetical protein
MSKNAVMMALLAMLAFGPTTAQASKGSSRGSYTPVESRSSYGRQEMMIDFSVHYVRDTQPEGQTDTAGRFSLGGMFNEWVGLDAVGQYEARSKSYLVGADFRLVPNEWLFMKFGAGAYSEKLTRTLALTPLAGAGILARLSRDYYFVTEATYFQVDERRNIGFGVGLGLSF